MALKKWKKLSSQKVLDHPRMKIYEDEVELPNGERTTYIYMGDLLDAAMVIPVRDDGKILLQDEYNYPPDEIMLQFPGGLLKEDDTPEQGALRELAEEAGLSGKLTSLGYFYPDNRKKAHKIHMFFATNLAPANAEKDPEEAFEDHWFTPDEISQLIKTGRLVNHTALAGWALYSNR